MKRLVLSLLLVLGIVSGCFASDSFDMSVHKYAKYAGADMKKNSYLTSDQKFALEQASSDPATYLPLADYYYGIGEYEKSLTLYKKAGEEGSPKGAFMAGLSYAHGDGHAENMTECKKWLEMAVEGDHPVAAYMLAEMYEEGIIKQGVTIAERNPEKAKQLFNAAAKHNVTKDTFATESGYSAFASKYNEPKLRKLTSAEQSKRTTQKMKNENYAMRYGGSVSHVMNSAYTGGTEKAANVSGNAQISSSLLSVLQANQAVLAKNPELNKANTGNRDAATTLMSSASSNSTSSNSAPAAKVNRSRVIIKQPRTRSAEKCAFSNMDDCWRYGRVPTRAAIINRKVVDVPLIKVKGTLTTNKPFVTESGRTCLDVVKQIPKYKPSDIPQLKKNIDADVAAVEANIKAKKYLVLNRSSQSEWYRSAAAKATYYLDNYNIVRKAVITTQTSYNVIGEGEDTAYKKVANCPTSTVVYFDKYGIPMKNIVTAKSAKNLKDVYVSTEYIVPGCNTNLDPFYDYVKGNILYNVGTEESSDITTEWGHISESLYWFTTMRYYQVAMGINTGTELQEYEIFRPMVISSTRTCNGKSVEAKSLAPRVDNFIQVSPVLYDIYKDPKQVYVPKIKDRYL